MYRPPLTLMVWPVTCAASSEARKTATRATSSAVGGRPQGKRSDTLAVHEIPKNHNASIDPRWKRDSMAVVLTDSQLAGFERGPAVVHVTATGGPQWLRTPPPLVREKPVRLVF